MHRRARGTRLPLQSLCDWSARHALVNAPNHRSPARHQRRHSAVVHGPCARHGEEKLTAHGLYLTHPRGIIEDLREFGVAAIVRNHDLRDSACVCTTAHALASGSPTEHDQAGLRASRGLARASRQKATAHGEWLGGARRLHTGPNGRPIACLNVISMVS